MALAVAVMAFAAGCGGDNESGASAATEISASYHTCAVLEDATARCWGSNSGGQLGPAAEAGAYELQYAPVPVLETPGGSPLAGITQISAGDGYTCAVLEEGTARCWGTNWAGQLGDGARETRSTPMPVLEAPGGSPLAGITQISAGDAQTCALLDDATARCWGGTEVGDGTDKARLTPVAVLEAPGGSPLAGITQISVGEGHYPGTQTCAVLEDATARCWGQNNDGQLGDGTESFPRSTPVAVLEEPDGSPLDGFIQISAGENHTCAVLEGGSARCWGSNASGQLGDDTGENASTPVSVDLG